MGEFMKSIRNFFAKIAVVAIAVFIVAGCGGGGVAVAAAVVIGTTILSATETHSAFNSILCLRALRPAPPGIWVQDPVVKVAVIAC